MSILKFLGIVAARSREIPAGGRASPRRTLSIESLELRSMLTGIDPLLEASGAFAVSEPEPQPADQTVCSGMPAGDYLTTEVSPAEPLSGPAEGATSAEPTTEPVVPAEEPTGGPAADPGSEPAPEPAPEEPPPSDPADEGGAGGVSIYPDFTSFVDIEEDGGWVRFRGSGTDNASLEGCTVHIWTDFGVNFTATMTAEGTFETEGYDIQQGTQVLAYFTDADGNDTSTISLIV